MVTAIVIPIICFYFYYITKKELKEQREKWHNLKNVTEEAKLKGKIIKIEERKERFFRHYFIYIVTLTIQTERTTIIANKVIPIEHQTSCTNPFLLGEVIEVYGCWKNRNFFQFNRFTTFPSQSHLKES